MMNDKLVSVVTATYNMGKYLPFAVRSVLNQTYSNIEIIVVNDGSTDDTAVVMEEYLKDPRVKYYYQENKGQAKAKNKGIELARGDYIGFLDADDIWEPFKLEKQIPLLGSYPKVGVVYSDVKYIDENNNLLDIKPQKKYYSGKITQHLFLDNFINFNSAVAKRECFEKFGGFDETIPMSIDWDLWLRFSTGYEFVFLPEATFRYRQWPGQMSHNFVKRYKCIIQVMENFEKQYPSELPESVIKKAWAITFTNRAWKARMLEHKRDMAIQFYIKALKTNPFFIPAWRGMLVTLFLPNRFRLKVSLAILTSFVIEYLFVIQNNLLINFNV